LVIYEKTKFTILINFFIGKGLKYYTKIDSKIKKK